MKELSIEEKARRYDEAIEIANNLHKDAVKMENNMTTKTCEIIFPELKESEDERIRKELISFFTERAKYTEDSTFNGLSSKEIIAWLEKLGEQKLNPVLDIEIPLGAKDSELQEASYYIPEGFHAEIEGNRVVIKKGEQKHIEEYNITGIKSKHAEGKLGEMIKNLKPVNEVLEQKPADNQFTPEQAGILDKHIDKFLEQNPWSEEDEKILNYLLWFYDTRFRWNDTCHDDIKFGDIVTFLKSLKDRVQPKPKQEWSEEDNQYLYGLIGLIEQSKAELPITLKGKAADNCINWLKSLRPQKKEALPQWRRLPLNDVSYAPDSWRVMDVITSTVGANSASVPALVKGDYYVPLFELEKFIRNI